MSAETKTRLFSLYAISLLDDYSTMPPSEEKPYDKSLEEITLSKLIANTKAQSGTVSSGQLPVKAIYSSSPNQHPNQQKKASITFKSEAAAQRVFQSRPSFKSLLSEYNRYHQGGSPIKSTPTGTSAPALASDFKFDRVEFIQMAQIPGKIIRPLKRSNSQC